MINKSKKGVFIYFCISKLFLKKLISITASLLVGAWYQLKEASASYPEEKFALMDEIY